MFTVDARSVLRPCRPALKNNNDGRFCCVPQCTVQAYKCLTLSFHGIPKDEQMKKIWLVRRDEGPLFRIRNWTRVCSRLFVPEDFRPLTLKGKQRRLKSDAVPSLFTWKNFQCGKERNQPAVRHPMSQANANTNQSENVGAETATATEAINYYMMSKSNLSCMTT
ncbi:uncharacterized protein LOC112566737 [Pomacea canaliculata]|uniref:uncharacterized protein LOC112566737 n=1 Tax=Pomacea canaliculata TaxID=400727 RepID=UPI000D727184|nr:uncharacterized protein LOC112566737 [Pomacea canaliculata]